jgi:hypothetical protein
VIIFGVGQGLGLGSRTNAGMAGVAPRDTDAAGGLINVAHHIGGAFGLGILVTTFDTAGSGAHSPRDLLADRVAAALTRASVFRALALFVTLIARPRRRSEGADGVAKAARLPDVQPLAHPATDSLPENTATA